MFRLIPPPPKETGWLPALIMAAIALVVSASRINHGLVDSPLPAGPGLTTDESINLRQGLYLFEAFTQHGPDLLLPDTARQVFTDPRYLPDYVPLGRFLIGAVHELTAWMFSGAELATVTLPAARLTSSAALAGTVLLMVLWATRRYGSRTAVTAAVLLLFMPRVVGHSRIASLETLTMFAWMAALLPLVSWWTDDRPPAGHRAAMSGFLWGLLMLVKIQAVLLPPVIVLYAGLRFRGRAVRPLFWMAVAGLTVFFAGWPWLWLDPWHHTTGYLLSTTQRSTVYNWYLGTRFEGRHTPWHYPMTMLALTVPLHTSVCLLLRLLQRRIDPAEKLLLTSIAVPLIVFAMPGTPVYDGARLFLFVSPAVALLAARGWNRFLDPPRSVEDDPSAAAPHRRRPSPAVMLFSAILVLDAAFTIPDLGAFAGDAWNNVVRMIPLPEDTLESCYWGDAINGDFWQQVPDGSTVAVAPVLHPVLLQDMMTMIPVVRQKNLRLEAYQYNPQQQRGLVLLLHRLADLRPALRRPPPGTDPVAEVRSDGRVLARLVDTTQKTWPEIPSW